MRDCSQPDFAAATSRKENASVCGGQGEGTYYYLQYAARGVVDTDGTKDGIATETDYVGPFVYEGDILQFFSTPEGRIVKTASGYEHQFMLKDHLGNVRALYGNPFEGGNLLPNSDCRTLDYFVNAQNVTRTLEKIDDETYIKFVAN